MTSAIATPYRGALRAPSFAIGDLYPERKGPAPSTAQLGNPHEAAAAAYDPDTQPATLPRMAPAALAGSPVMWLVLAAGILFALGMRKG
jgi:hypothetical protein